MGPLSEESLLTRIFQGLKRLKHFSSEGESCHFAQAVKMNGRIEAGRKSTFAYLKRSFPPDPPYVNRLPHIWRKGVFPSTSRVQRKVIEKGRGSFFCPPRRAKILSSAARALIPRQFFSRKKCLRVAFRPLGRKGQRGRLSLFRKLTARRLQSQKKALESKPEEEEEEDLCLYPREQLRLGDGKSGRRFLRG